MSNWFSAMSSLDVFAIHEKVVECTNKNIQSNREIWVYPGRTGYRVEILPIPDRDTLTRIVECIKKETGLSARIEERPYGLVVIIS